MKEAIKSELISIIETFGFELRTDNFKELFADLLAKKEDHKQFKVLETFSIISTWHLKLFYGSIFVCFFEANIQIILYDSQFLGKMFFWEHPYTFESKKEVIKNLCFGIEKYRFKYSKISYEVPRSFYEVPSSFIDILTKRIIPLLKPKERDNFKKVLNKYEVNNLDEITLEKYYLIIYSYLNKDWDIPLTTGYDSDDEYLKTLLKQR